MYEIQTDAALTCEGPASLSSGILGRPLQLLLKSVVLVLACSALASVAGACGARTGGVQLQEATEAVQGLCDGMPVLALSFLLGTAVAEVAEGGQMTSP